MNSKHIIGELYNGKLLGTTTTNKKDTCISKKKDYLDCIDSNNKKFDKNQSLNNCSQLFWNWYIYCKTSD